MFALRVALLVLLSASVSLATTNTKLLLHGASHDEGWGTAGWVILPNLGTGVTPTVAVAGVRYNATAWWFEAMTGALVIDHEARALLDVRVSYDALAPVHFWANSQVFPDNGQAYLYLDSNVDIAPSLKLGMESENQLFPGAPDDWSIGPRVVAPFGDFTLIAAHQWHSDGSRVIWLRAVINF